MAFDINFSLEKNELLKAARGVCFDDVLEAITANKALAHMDHPGVKKSNQKIYVVKIDDYAYAVPYVINKKKKEIFLKTLYPSRVLTKKYLKEGKDEKKEK